MFAFVGWKLTEQRAEPRTEEAGSRTKDGLARPSLYLGGNHFFALLGVAALTTAASALANNLPVTAAVATVLTAGPASYAALIGLTVGALATPHGSVATMIASDLAGEDGELRLKTLVPATGLAVFCATFLLWATL